MLHNSMFVFDFMKNKVNIYILVFPLVVWVLFWFFVVFCYVFVLFFCVFPPCAFHLALLSDFLSSRLRRVATAAVVAAATVAV